MWRFPILRFARSFPSLPSATGGAWPPPPQTNLTLYKCFARAISTLLLHQDSKHIATSLRYSCFLRAAEHAASHLES